jgi:hypothetical protein
LQILARARLWLLAVVAQAACSASRAVMCACARLGRATARCVRVCGRAVIEIVLAAD